MKKGFTLVELMVILVIIAIIGTLILTVISGSQSKEPQPPFIAQVVNKYDIQESLGTSRGASQIYNVLHVDVKRQGLDLVEPMATESYTVFANLIEGQWYSFHVVGVYNETLDHFPMIVQAYKVPDPNQ